MGHHRGEQLHHHTHGKDHSHPPEGSCCHEHGRQRVTPAGSPEPSAREKLILRLEYALRHNSDHATFYERLAEEAGGFEGEVVAEEIREVARYAHRQNEHILKALALVRAR